MGNVAVGGVQKLIPGEQGKEKYAEAVGQFVMDRYGGLDEFKRTLAEDPVGLLADASTVLGGAGLAARAPGMIGKAARVSSRVGDIIDPINLAARGVTKGTSKVMAPAAAAAAGALTGQSGDVIKVAAEYGP